MTKSMKTLVLTAAISGLLGGASASVTQSTSTPNPQTRIGAEKLGTSAWLADKGKHSCKGKNSCKGQGGCSTGDNGCNGKNSCKGKGGCNTEGKKLV